MEYNIGMSRQKDAKICVDEATAKFKNPKLILFFSPVEQFEEYTQFIYQKFPNSISMGATTIAAFSKEGADKQGLKVIGIENGIRCSADVIEDIDEYPIKYTERVKKCVDDVGTAKNTICLEFTTALLCAEESVLNTLNAVLEKDGITVFGGSAGDVGTAVGTKVALNGKIRPKSTVFAILHNEGGAIKIFRENIYVPITGNVLTATKVESFQRTVYEYNREPATRVFARELGISESQVSQHIDTNPIGRIIGDELYITANCNETQNHGMAYHARIFDNSKVLVLHPGEYRSIIQETKERIKREIPKPSFSIMCHCLARTILFTNEGYLDEYSKEMHSVLGDYIGFSGYGEQYGSQHFNQTMTVAVFE